MTDNFTMTSAAKKKNGLMTHIQEFKESGKDSALYRESWGKAFKALFNDDDAGVAVDIMDDGSNLQIHYKAEDYMRFHGIIESTGQIDAHAERIMAAEQVQRCAAEISARTSRLSATRQAPAIKPAIAATAENV